VVCAPTLERRAAATLAASAHAFGRRPGTQASANERALDRMTSKPSDATYVIKPGEADKHKD
jgi:hypothetical protein